jgi:hypothetical protein
MSSAMKTLRPRFLRVAKREIKPPRVEVFLAIFPERRHHASVEQRLGLLEVERVEPLGEPPIDRSEQFACLLRLALRAPEPRQRIGRMQLRAFGRLRRGNFDCHLQA